MNYKGVVLHLQKSGRARNANYALDQDFVLSRGHRYFIGCLSNLLPYFSKNSNMVQANTRLTPRVQHVGVSRLEMHMRTTTAKNTCGASLIELPAARFLVCFFCIFLSF